MNYVTRVQTNLKVGADVQLSPKTLIVGPKGSGKSTIVNAIELALTGRVGDLAGRADVGAASELWSLAPEGETELRAQLSWSGGQHSAWSQTEGGKPVRGGPTFPLPLREVKEALLGSAETARKWLARYVSSGSSWKNELGGSLAQRASFLSDDIPEALEAARMRGREARTKAKQSEEGARSMSAGLAPEPTDAEIERAREAETMAARAEEYGQASARLEKLRTEREDVEHRLQEARIALSVAVLAPADSETAEALLAAMRAQIASGATRCGVCGGERPDMTPHVAGRLLRMEERTKGLVTAAAEQKEAEFMAGAAEADLARIDREIETIRTMLPDAGWQRAAPPPIPSHELLSLRIRWQTAKVHGKRGDDLNREADEWQLIVDLLSKRLEQSVEDGRSAFEKRVQSYLPANMVFGLNLSPVRIGIRRGNVIHTALSGAEWATVTLALAMAVVEMSDSRNFAESDDSPHSFAPILIPEERQFNGFDLRDVMIAWKDAPGQVILVSPIMPTGMVDGWTVIGRPADGAADANDLGAEEAALADPIAGGLTDLGDDEDDEPDPLAHTPRPVRVSTERHCACPTGPKGRKRHVEGCQWKGWANKRKKGADPTGGAPPTGSSEPTPLD